MEKWEDRIGGILERLEERAEAQCEREATEAYAKKSGYIRACEDVKSKIRTEIYKDLEKDKKDKKGTMPGRKKVFICSPYRGDRQGNAERAAGYSRMAYEKGYLPIAPHLLFPQFLDDEKEEERQAGIQMGLDLLLYCDEVWVFGGITEGMLTEIAVAEGHGKRVRAMDPGARRAIERAAGGRQDEET